MIQVHVTIININGQHVYINMKDNKPEKGRFRRFKDILRNIFKLKHMPLP